MAPIFDRYSDFYLSRFGPFVRRMRVTGPLTSIDAQQGRGDMSGTATGEILVARAYSRARHHIDFGNGLKSDWWMPRDVAICPPHFSNRVFVESDNRVQIVSIPIHTLAMLTGETGDFGALHDRSKPTPRLDRLIGRCFGAEALADLEATELAIALFRELRQMSGRRRAAGRVPETLAPHRLRRAIERIGATDLPPPPLVELAALCDLSPNHFCRAFRAQTGLPPHRYAIVRRMERARDLLRDDTLPVATIAHLLGYDDAAYFGRSFTRETGLSPSAWRAANR